jgi:hypothetical protein
MFYLISSSFPIFENLKTKKKPKQKKAGGFCLDY